MISQFAGDPPLNDRDTSHGDDQQTQPTTCVLCNKETYDLIRYMCRACYKRVLRRGEQHNYPKMRRPVAKNPDRHTVWKCRKCDEKKVIQARGLCNQCYNAAYHDGTYIDFERRIRKQETILEEWDFFRWTDPNITVPVVAHKLGIKAESLARALKRARDAGDPRAVFNYKGVRRAKSMGL